MLEKEEEDKKKIERINQKKLITTELKSFLLLFEHPASRAATTLSS